MYDYATYQDLYELQLNAHRADQGINRGGVGVPIAAIFSEDRTDWGYERFLRAAREVMGATVTEYMAGGSVSAVVLDYANRAPEVWVDAHLDSYTNIYERFCVEKLKLRPSDSLQSSGFDVDHAYCKSAVPSEASALIRLFLVPSSVNKSWGGYFERKLKDFLRRAHRAGIRSETVAIRAKICGIKAPRIGSGKERNIKNVERVVDRLIDNGMISAATRSNDIEALSSFCNISDGVAEGINTRVSRKIDGRWKVATSNIYSTKKKKKS